MGRNGAFDSGELFAGHTKRGMEEETFFFETIVKDMYTTAPYYTTVETLKNNTP